MKQRAVVSRPTKHRFVTATIYSDDGELWEHETSVPECEGRYDPQET